MTDLRKTPLRRLLMLSSLMGGASLVEDTATGNPLTFTTDLAKPLVSIEVPFTPIQEGSGDPSPQNVRPIVPWEGLKVWNGGKNLFDKSTATVIDGYIDILNQYEVIQSLYSKIVVIPVKSNTTYTIQKDITSRFMLGDTDKSNPQVGDKLSYIGSNASAESITFTTHSNAVNLCVWVFNGNLDTMSFQSILDSIQLEAGQTATAYVPYKHITETDISFPSPVYGGTLDAVTGVLTVEYGAYDLGNVETWSKSSNGNKFYATVPAYKYAYDDVFYCNAYKFDGIGNSSKGYYGADNTIRYHYYTGLTAYEVYIHDERFDNKEDFKQAIAGTYIVYPLATPQEIQLTPSQITALVGNNTLWSDANGDMIAVYFKKA